MKTIPVPVSLLRALLRHLERHISRRQPFDPEVSKLIDSLHVLLEQVS